MKVLLIGDSIRMFYANEVKEQLGEDYEIYAPKENCRFSSFVLNSLRFWLEDFPIPDVIHFNVGLWDTAILYHEDGCFTGLDEYVATMKKILRVLKSTGAKVIFATTTPVSDEKYKLEGPMPPAHRNEDICRYNEAVCKAFEDEEIIINDLHALMYENRESLLKEDMIHPNEDGVKLLGTAVANAIRNCGARTNNPDNIQKEQTARNEKTIQ